MRPSLFIALSAGLLSSGCATAVRQMPAQIDFAISESAPFVGEPRILAERVDPRKAAVVAAAGDDVTVTFANRGRSLSAEPRHVALPDGGHVTLWTEGTAEWGRRAMARSFGPDGDPRSGALVLSSPEMDVLGTPSGVATDGHRIVATFCASLGEAFDLVAVPIERL